VVLKHPFSDGNPIGHIQIHTIRKDTRPIQRDDEGKGAAMETSYGCMIDSEYWGRG
jgi:hypothetical protein